MLVQAQSVEDIIMQQNWMGYIGLFVTDEQGQLLESWNDQNGLYPLPI